MSSTTAGPGGATEALDALGVPCLVTDGEFRIVYRNAAAEELALLARLPDGLRTVFSEGQLQNIRENMQGGLTAEMLSSPLAGGRIKCLFAPFSSDRKEYLVICRPDRAGQEDDPSGFGEAGVVDAAFRRPMGEIFANLASINRKQEARDDRSLEPYLDAVNEQTYVLMRNWSNMAEMMRVFTMNQPPRRPVNFWEELSELCEAAFTVSKQGGYDIRYSFPQTRDCVVCHFPSIARVMMNLISNACRAGGKSGSVTITGRTLGHTVLVSVADDGAGVRENPETLFSPYVSRWNDENGAGLGLPVSKQIIYAHGGTMTLSSPPEGGCCVSFMLPLSDEAPAERMSLDSGWARYLENRFSEVYVGLCSITPPPRA